MANEQNLTPFKPGNKAGVGHGRPKGKSLTTLLRKAIEAKLTLKNSQTGFLEAKKTKEWLIMSLVRDGVKGDLSTIKFIFETLEGKAIQRTEITGEDGGPIQHHTQHTITVEHMHQRIGQLIGKKEEKVIENG